MFSFFQPYFPSKYGVRSTLIGINSEITLYHTSFQILSPKRCFTYREDFPSDLNPSTQLLNRLHHHHDLTSDSRTAGFNQPLKIVHQVASEGEGLVVNLCARVRRQLTMKFSSSFQGFYEQVVSVSSVLENCFAFSFLK